MLSLGAHFSAVAFGAMEQKSLGLGVPNLANDNSWEHDRSWSGWREPAPKWLISRGRETATNWFDEFLGTREDEIFSDSE